MTNRTYKGANKSDKFCFRCGKPLNPNRTVQLNLDRSTNTFTTRDTGETFGFGVSCAKKELA